MANRSLFQSLFGRRLPATDTRTFAGGSAYALSPEHALAQYAVTGCFHSTFYAWTPSVPAGARGGFGGGSAESQLQTVLALAKTVETRFLAQLAIYARERGAMKDMPAMLCAILASRDGALFERIFDRAIDTPRVLRTFVQIMRSGVTGRKSLGSRPKRAVQNWLAARSDEQIFFASIGNDPSLADVIRMVHPKPATPTREALYAYLIGRPHDPSLLPSIVTEYESFKQSLIAAN
jgi:60 kDa SS-A/Ro ribonucleoprotein